MSRNLQPYQRALGEAEAELKAKLANGRASASEVAVARRAWEIMATQLRSSPDSVLVYERMSADVRSGLRGADRWRLDMYRRANDELFPHLASDAASAAYTRKQQEYLDLGLRIVQSPDMRYRSVVDRQRGRSYLYRENPLVPRIMQVIAHELMRWFNEYPVDREFYRRGWYLSWNAEAGLGLFLQERPDIVALLRIAQTLPLDTEVREVPVDRPAVVEAVELAIGLVPVVGSIVAAYEAYTGVDLFGYHLTDLERGILAATVLLPIAGRVVKGGRVIYSEARMVAMYGRDAAAWSRTLRAGGQATASARSLRIIEEAETAIRAQRSLDRTLAQRAATELPNVVRGSAPVSSSVDQAVTDLFRQLSSRHGILRSLDEHALQRVLEKGPNVDHLKGQLLEEIIEARVVPWLRDRAGSFALGVQTGGRQLEFIPGHLIRDASGRQITDGILVYRNDGILEIAAVFEAKAGRRAARELSLASGSISSLSAAERAELRAYARDVLREQRAAAQEAGTPFSKTLDEVEREVALSERGGQVRRDIERLSENADGTLAQIRLGSDLIPVRLSPTRTKFLGVLPRDVNRSLIERELREGGFSFEIIGADISQRDLRSMASEMVPLATTMAGAP
ncbi:pre-toxin TG domain-containing protein [Nitrosomonas europaea]|uniref:pre-toxin TG domain-containing protein n=1 Tax=Nitrosomonas europaea TaxID=915 RepID=UPI0032660B53